MTTVGVPYTNCSARAPGGAAAARRSLVGQAPSTALGRIFERFHRAHPELDEQLGVEGSGLGLAIASECVKSLQGWLDVESEERVGTAFRITIPKKMPRLDA